MSVGRKAFGECENAENGGVFVGKWIGARLLDVADYKDAACFGDSDFFAAGEDEIEFGIGRIDEVADGDAADQRLEVIAESRQGDEDFLRGMWGETFGLG